VSQDVNILLSVQIVFVDKVEFIKTLAVLPALIYAQYVQIHHNVFRVQKALSWILSIRHALKRDAHQADSDYLTQIPVLARMEPIDQAINASVVSFIVLTVLIMSRVGSA
jgi:hypothetical protein